MRLSVTLIFSLCLGFISMSLERIWAVLFALSAGGTISGVFSLVTGIILLGLAGGTYLGYPYCKTRHLDMYRFMVKCAFLACVFSYILIPLYSNILVMSVFLGFLIWIPLLLAIFIAIGSLIPILCHVTKRAPWQSVGRLIGWVYGCYLLGAALGMLITGGFLTQSFSGVVLFRWFSLALVSLTILLAPWLNFKQASQKKLIIQLGTATIALLGVLAWVDGQTLQKLFFKDTFNHRKVFSHSLESKQGMLSAIKGVGNQGDALYIGGAYQGHFNIDPVFNANKIDRAYFISSLHPDPLEVLQIGLKDGSWASVFAGNPGTESLSVVDPNISFRRLIDRYSEIKPLLHNDKVNLFFEDGRKFITKLGAVKYDIIAVNNPSSSQEGITRYLSKDFILLAARHLKEGGLLAVNSGGCQHVYTTMAQFFPFVVTMGDIVVGAYGNMQVEKNVLSQRLESFRPNGSVVFDTSEPPAKKALEKLIKVDKKNARARLLEMGGTITDNNMRCEFQEHLLVRAMKDWRKKVFAFISGD